jgi:hypothetical protein
MEDHGYRSWKEFNAQQYRRTNTVQLCIDELADEMYFDDGFDKKCDLDEELDFDY